jgi:queuosine precursor transporter
MINILLWIAFMVLGLSVVLASYWFFGKSGLYASIAISIILANIQVAKLVELFGITVTMGNILYGSIFFSTDLLSEFHGKKAAKKGVWIGFFALAVAMIYMQIALLFKPAAEDFIQPHLVAVFSLFPRIAFASLIAYIISQQHDVWAFNFWKKKTNGHHLWLRNNASTLASQIIDSVIFTTLAFWGVFSGSVFLQILLTTYIFKLIVAITDTPFIYLAKHLMQNKKSNED